MIWHILYVVYCIDQGARGVSFCQEASVVGCAVFVSLRTGMPAARASACRWRAGLSHLLFPRNLHVYQRERGEKRACTAPYITAKASLSTKPLLLR